jgi:ArsR family transcriptional regulator
MKAMQVMSALSQATRFDVYTRLVQALPGGVASGDLAAGTNSAPSAMSAHLAILSRAGLVTSEKVGKTVIYRGVTGPVEELSGLLADRFTSRSA